MERRRNGNDSRAERERRSREAWATKEALLEDDLCGMGPPELPEADEGALDAAPPIVADLSLDAMPSSIYAVPASVVFSRDGSAGAARGRELRRVLVRNCGASSVPVVVMRPQSQRYTVRPAVEGPHDADDAATSLWDGAPAGAAVALRLIRPGEAHQFFVERAAPCSRADAADGERTPAALYIFTRYFPLRVPLLVEGGRAAPPPSPRRGGLLLETQPRSMLSVCGPPPKLFETIVRRARAAGRADAVAPQQPPQRVRAPRPAPRAQSPQSPPQSSAENAASKLNSDEGEEGDGGGEVAPACAPSPRTQPDAQPEQHDSSRFVSRVDDAASARALLTAMRAKRSTARALGAKQPATPVPSRAQQHAEEAQLAALRDPEQQTAERRRQQREFAAVAGGGAPASPAAEGGGDAADVEWVEREYRRRLEAAASADAARRSKKAAAKARKQAKAKAKAGGGGSLSLAEAAASGKGGSLRVSVKPGQRLRIAPPRRTRERRK